MNSANEQLEIYKHLTYTELFNYDIAHKILKNWDVLITQLPEYRQKKYLEKKKDYDITLSLKKICKNTNGQNLVKYNHSRGSSSLAKGRLFATSVSLQNLPRELRGALATGRYYDLDMVNAHPVILAQYCKKNGIDCKCLDKYVKSRDTIIEQICSGSSLLKDKVKKTFLSALNGGEQELDNKFFIEFKKELKLIHLQINSLNKDLEKVIKRRKDYNINGSITNTILCDIENEILLTSVSYLIKKGYNVDVLVFDGLMVRNNKELPNLEELSSHIKTTLDYDIKFVEKPLINIFDFDKIPDEIKEEATYPSMKEEFEKNHFKILYPPLYVLIDDKNNIITQSRTSIIQTNEHVRTKISKKNANGKDIIVETSFIDEWIRDPTIRYYDKLEFYPNRNDCPVNHYNLFKGFKAENYEPINDKKKIEELIKPILYHMTIIAGEHSDFLSLYFAHILQLPSKKTNVNIVVSGKDGTGKSILFDYFRNMILGPELSSQTDDADELFCRFSNLLPNKVLIQLDEISKKDFDGKKAEKLKNITVSKTINYEKKGVDTITLNNYSNTVMTTNNEFTISVSQTDRRNVFFKCKETHMQDPEYFSNLVSEFSREEVARAFYEYLMNYKLKSLETEWNEDVGLQQMRPITEYHKDIKKQCITMDMRFLSNIIDDKGYEKIQATELYKKYCDWHTKCNHKTPILPSHTFFNKLIVNGITKTKSGCMYYHINRVELKAYLEKNNSYDETAYMG